MGAGQSGVNRVIRGGSWNNHARNVRAANRNGNSPDIRNDNLGVRLSRAHQPASRPVPDPIGIQSALARRGEKQRRSEAKRESFNGQYQAHRLVRAASGIDEYYRKTCYNKRNTKHKHSADCHAASDYQCKTAIC